MYNTLCSYLIRQNGKIYVQSVLHSHEYSYSDVVATGQSVAIP